MKRAGICEWERAKFTKDEEGAIGLVMKKRLFNVCGFVLRYEISVRYLEEAERGGKFYSVNRKLLVLLICFILLVGAHPCYTSVIFRTSTPRCSRLSILSRGSPRTSSPVPLFR